jgi:hypothetical protein
VNWPLSNENGRALVVSPLHGSLHNHSPRHETVGSVQKMPHQGPTAWLLQLARRVTLCPPSGLDRVTSGEQNATALRATLVIDLYLDIKAGYATRLGKAHAITRILNFPLLFLVVSLFSTRTQVFNRRLFRVIGHYCMDTPPLFSWAFLFMFSKHKCTCSMMRSMAGVFFSFFLHISFLNC